MNLKILKYDLNDCKVIIRLLNRRALDDCIDHLASNLVHSLLLIFLLELGLLKGFPAEILAVDVGKAVEDAVATQDNKIVEVFVQSEVRDLWLSDDNPSFSAIFI